MSKDSSSHGQHHSPPIDVFLQREQPLILNLPARSTCVEGLGRSENSRGPAPAPAERRGHEPRRVVTAAAARRFLDVLHVLWKKTSSNPLPFTNPQKNVSDALKSQN